MRKITLKWFMVILAIISFTNSSTAQIIFQDDFSTDQGWTMAGTWTRGLATVEPATDHTGDGNILANPLGTDYTINMVREDVTSPVFDCSTTNFVELSYWSFSGCENNTYDHMGVEVFDGTTWIEIWNNGTNSFQETEWTFYSFNVSTYAVGNANFQVRFYMGITDGSVTYSGFAIDDFKLENTTCPKPILLTASNISMSDAIISWTSGSSETAWNVEWDTTGFAQGTGTIINNLADTFTTITGLAPGTSYDFYVQADCGGGDFSAWTGPYTFTTPDLGDACTAPIQISLPTDFTANVYQDLAQTTVGRGNNSDTTCLDYYDGGEDIFYELTITSDMVVNIILDPKTTTYTGIALTDACPTSSNCIEISTNSSTGIHGMQQVHLTAGTYFIMIDTWPSPNNIPDFDLTIELVTCPNPMNLGVTLNSATSANLEWITGGSNTWNILFGTAGFDTTGLGPLAADITTNPLLVDTLQPETTYEFYVRDICAINDSSQWVGPFQFTTTASCPNPTNLNAANITANEAYINWNGYFATNWDILFGVAGFDTTGLAPTVNDFINDTLFIDTLTQVTSYEFYVRADCGQDNIDVSLWVGPFQFTTDVSCPAPTSLTATNITDNSATLSWITGGSLNWNFVYGPQSFNMNDSTATALVDTFINLTGLADGTAYEFYVQDSCGVGDVSTWSGPFSFSTDCGVSTPEYIQDFTSYLPLCWEEAQGQLATTTTFTSTATSNWLSDGFGNVGTTGSAKLNIYSTGRYDWLISKSIDLGTSINYQLEFDLALTDYANAAAPNTNGIDDKFAVVISTDNGVTWSDVNTLRLWDNAGSTYVYNDIPYTGTHIVIDLTGYTGVVKFGLYGESTISNADNDLFVDNFRVREIPSCPEPIYLTISNITNNSAIASWTPFGSESDWTIEYGETGFVQGTGTFISVTDTFGTLTSLLGNTDYDYYVKAVCSVGDESVWSGPITFTTLCDAIDAPYTQNFDALALIPDCWNQTTNGGMEWFYNSLTPSTGTGPQNGDNTSGTGYFAFIEATNGSSTSDTAILYSPLININTLTNPALEFYYNMYGADMGTLTVQIFDGSLWNDIFTISGNQGDIWERVLIDLSGFSGTIQARFIGVRGNNFTSDVSIDDVSFLEGPTCWMPTNLSAENITGETADLTWITGGASTWNVMFGTAGFDTTGLGPLAVDITTNPLYVDTLTPVTTYEFYVRDVCSATDTSEWVGPFQFTTTESCPTPTDLGLSSLTATSADLTWNGYFATNWDILFGTAGFDTTGLAPTVDNTANNPFLVDTLTPNTSYEFYVRADCGTDSSLWAGPYTFTTNCVAITSYPYEESFETGAISNCWNQEQIVGTSLVWTVETAGTSPTVSPYEGNNLLKLNCYSASTGETRLSTVNFDLTAQINPHLDFFMIHDDGYTSSDDRVIVQISTDGVAWTNIDTISRYQAISATWTEYNYDLSSYIGQTIQVGLYGITEYGNNIFVDKLMIYNQITDLTIINPGNQDYSSCYYTGQDTIPFNVKNVGSSIISANDTIYGWYEIDGATAVADTFILATDLNPTDTAFFNFAQTADLAGLTVHNFKVYLEYVNDEDQTNDTTNGTFTHYLPSVSINQGDTVILNSSDFPYMLNISGTYDSIYWYNADSSLTGGFVQFVINDFGWYYVSVMDINGCYATDSILVENALEIAYFDNELRFELYPNPNNGQFYINATLLEKQDINIDIIDINGKTVYSRNYNNVDVIRQDIDIKAFAKGVYYIRLSNDKILHQEKIVIQ